MISPPLPSSVINDPEEQRTCLNLGKRAGLDVATITKSVVEQIRNIGMVTKETNIGGWALIGVSC